MTTAGGNIPRTLTAVPDDHLQQALDALRQKLLPLPVIPHRTKAVRLILLPEGHDPESDDITSLAAQHDATKADVFIQIQGSQGIPWSWLGGPHLVSHHDAVTTDREATVVLMITQGEQLQWESPVPFEIVDIKKANDNYAQGFLNRGDSPANPFDKLGERMQAGQASGDMGKPLRSGMPTLNNGREYDQLYKITFHMWPNGRGADRITVDPDTYCDWR